MSRPLIGITMSVKADPPGADLLCIRRDYADCLEAAGAVPILIPFQSSAADIAPILDGLLIPGGADFDASYFGEENHPATSPEEPCRYPHEAELYALLDPRLPILGICYGCQFLNVVRGGTLIQHLPDVVGHNDHSGSHIQRYRLEAGSLAARVCGTEHPEGKSNHHQAIAKVGEGLKVTGRTEDGVVEAIEDTTGRWVLGLQWHPEKTPDNPATQHIFREFAARAKEYKESR